MREKIYNIINKIYGVLMTISFFAGALPLLGFIVALFIGGESAEAISLFLKNDFYPYVIALASIAVFIGWIAMYIGGKESLSIKSFGNKKAKKKSSKHDSEM